MATTSHSTLKNLGALCERHSDGSGSADLSNLKRLLQGSADNSLEQRFARLKADLSRAAGSVKQEAPQKTTGLRERRRTNRGESISQDRLNRVMAG